MNIKILIATHKEYRMPKDSMYLPVHVGKEISGQSLPFIGDNTGDHISAKNPSFCELTALYWAWKNLDADYIGLTHYRRHFTLHKPSLFCQDKFPYILSSTEVEPLLQKHSVLLPKQRNYFIETNYSHFIHAHPSESINTTREILGELFPSHLASFDLVMQRKKAHRFNMLIMKREQLHDYCHWLFTILFELEKRLDTSSYTAYNQRIFGFISERLLDVYLEAHKLSYAELPVMFMEKEHWIKKGFAFLKRKFIG